METKPAEPKVDTALVERMTASVTLRKQGLDANERLRESILDRLPFDQFDKVPLCKKPVQITAADIDPDRSLFVHDVATLTGADFSLARTYGQLASQANASGASGITAAALFRDLWDTQNTAAQAATPEGAHCDDDGGTLNGFPLKCRAGEGAQAKVADLAAEMAKYKPIGLVNRLDLAGAGWRNCGEHRIVYGRTGGGGRSFIIFESVLPNPSPGCKSACRPVAAFWQGLSAIADAGTRAKELEKFFYQGLPGFRPVVHVDHYAARGDGGTYGASGSGQIRTNQFMAGPWLLKEFKLALDCTSAPCLLATVPIMVKVNPFGELWRQEAAASGPLASLAMDFQGDVIAQVGDLTKIDLNVFSYAVDLAHDAADSDAQSGGAPDNYLATYDVGGPHTAGLFRHQLANSPALNGLNETQVVNRAIALSCAGCHQPSTFGLGAANAVGPSQSWPASAGFVHTLENPASGVHALSPALTDVFLPARRQALLDQLNSTVCPCRFKRPLTPKLDRVLFLQERALAEKAEQRAQILAELDAAAGPTDAARLNARKAAQRRLAQLDARIVEQIKVALRAENIDVSVAPSPVELAATRLDLPAVRAAGADPAQVRAARQKAVLDLVRSEPPRRTVTGHFRVH